MNTCDAVLRKHGRMMRGVVSLLNMIIRRLKIIEDANLHEAKYWITINYGALLLPSSQDALLTLWDCLQHELLLSGRERGVTNGYWTIIYI